MSSIKVNVRSKVRLTATGQTTFVKKIVIGTPIRSVVASGSTLGDLSDTTITSASNNQILVFDSASQKFINTDSATLVNLTVSGDIVPAADSASSLGSASKKFKNLFLSGDTIQLGTLRLKDSNGGLGVIDTAGAPKPIGLRGARQQIRSFFSAADDLTYNPATGIFGFNVETVYTKTNFDSDLGDALDGGTGITYDSSSDTISITNTGVTAATYGSASQVPQIAVNAQGQITSASNVSIAGVTGVTYDSSNGALTVSTSAGSSFTDSINLNPFSTTNLSEGTNLYFTTGRADARVNAGFSAKSTTNLSEGNNLYYTTARADSDARSALIGVDAGGDGSFAYDSATGKFTYTGPSAAETRAHFSGGTGITYNSGTGAITTTDGDIVHDNLSGFVADEHVAHSGVSIIAGKGLSGGGTIASSRTINIDSANVRGMLSGGTGITYNSGTGAITTTDGDIVHDNLSGFVADEHIAHSGVSITAGTGLTGGGTIAANRTINVVGGKGITANANDIQVDSANLVILARNALSGSNGISYTSGTGDIRAPQPLDSAANPTFNQLRGPAEFVIDPAAIGDATGTVKIMGNLQVEGTQTTINSSTIVLKDKNIVIADSAADSSALNGAGFTWGDSAIVNNPTFNYSHSNARLEANRPINATSFVGNLTGNASSATSLATGRTIDVTGVTATGQSFDGTGDINIEVTAVPASLLTGTIDNARISLDAAEIPNLPTSKITTGVFDSARVPVIAFANDAGTLDGVNSTSFLRSDQDDTTTGTIGINGINKSLQVGDITGDEFTEIKHISENGLGFTFTFDNASVISNLQGTTNQFLVLGDGNGLGTETLLGVSITTDGSTYTKKLNLIEDGTLYIGSSGTTRVLTTADEGSGNGLDADTLDGVNSTSFLRSDAADTKTSGNLIFNDGVEANFGTGADLRIFHADPNSIIRENNGNPIYIQTNGTIHLTKNNASETLAKFIGDGAVELYYNNSKKFETTNAGATVSGLLSATLSTATQTNITSLGTLTGLTSTGDVAVDSAGGFLFDVSDKALEFGDNYKATFGTGADLQISHNGTNSFVGDDAGGSTLVIHAGTILLERENRAEKFLEATVNGSVDLYFDGTKRFETTDSGAKVTGQLNVDSATASGNLRADGGRLILGNDEILTGGSYLGMKTSNQSGNNEYMIISGVTDGNTYLSAKTDTNVYIRGGGNTNTHQIQVGTSYARAHGDFQFDSGGAIQFDKSDKALEFGDNYKASFGAGGDLTIRHSGSNSIISDVGTGDLLISGSQVRLMSSNIAENMLTATTDGAVALYYDNSKKFETTDSGVAVFGNLLVGANTPATAPHSFSSWTAANASDAHIDALIDGSTFGALYETRNSAHLVIGIQNNDVNDGVSIISSDSNFNTHSVYNNHVISFKADGDVEIDSQGAIMYDKSDKALEFGDNYKATFGTGADLQIYHDGSNSYIDEGGTGNLYIRAGGNNNISLTDNAVYLYYSGSTKLQTTSDGASITGDLTLTGTDDGAGSKPEIKFVRQSASPADFDYIGGLAFFADNSADQNIEFGTIEARLRDVTDGTEDFGGFELFGIRGGVARQRFMILNEERLGFMNYQFLRFEDGSANHFTIAPPSSLSASQTVTLPDATGTVLTTGNSNAPTTTTSSSDADFVLIDDGGTMKKITPSNLGIGGGGGGGGLDSAAVLTVTGTGVFNTTGEAGTAATAGTATNVTVVANNTTNETVYLTFVDGATGTQGLETDTSLTYNPATNLLTLGTGGDALTIDDGGAITANGNTLVLNSTSATALQHNGSTKLQTGSSGIDVNGSVIVGTSDTFALDGSETTTTATTQVALVTVAKASYGAAKFIITAVRSGERQISEILATHDGTTAVATEYGTITTNGLLATYDVDINGDNFRLLVTPNATTSTTFKVVQTLIEA